MAETKAARTYEVRIETSPGMMITETVTCRSMELFEDGAVSFLDERGIIVAYYGRPHSFRLATGASVS